MGDLTKTCPICGRVFARNGRETTRWEKQKCCSRDCAGVLRRRDLAERFWGLVDRTTEDACWCWRGHLNNKGYGRFNIRRTAVYAHRVAYELTFGPFEPDLKVLHHCDNPPCCNPAHLFLGTQADNNADCRAKGRHSCGDRPRGSAHKRARLSENEAVDARRRYAAGEVSQRDLAKELGVSRRAVQFFLSREHWNHV